MPNITGLVTPISDAVVAALAEASYPALTDGAILLGRQFQFEQSAPPRIIFTPTKSTFPAKDIYGPSPITRSGPYTAQELAQIRNESIRSEFITFEVRCWGVSPDQNPALDFDYTQALYQQVIRTVNEIAYGSYELSGGEWTDSKFTSGQLIRDGREFVFNLTLFTPIQKRLTALPLAPDNVEPQNTTKLELPTGEIETGCQGN